MNSDLISKLKNILKIIEKNEFIISANIVGSTLDKKISEINDIDFVIISKTFSKKVLDKINNDVRKNRLLIEKVLKKKIFINNNFGPIKNIRKKSICLHIMIYDIESHIDHMIKSPFTCYDWNRKLISGNLRSLSEIVPIIKPNYDDLIKSRRGIKSYINDLDNKVITFQKYFFKKNGKYILSKEKYKVNENDVVHFLNHILINLVSNYLKIKNNKNIKFKYHQIKKVVVGDNLLSKHYFDIIYKKKIDQFSAISDKIILEFKTFIENFQNKIKKIKLNNVYFIRHAKTKLNDGTFLSKRNPEIISNNRIKNKIVNINKIYVSKSKRTLQTAKLFYKNLKTISDKRLNEIDYGDAEGLKPEEYKLQYPKKFYDWVNKKDPKFPNGENYKDLKYRVKNFLKSKILSSNKNICVFTHNNILRMILYINFENLNFQQMLCLQIKHLEMINIKFNKSNLYLNINNQKKRKFYENIFYK